MAEDEVTYFESPAAWRKWLAAHHTQRTYQWVGYYKRATGKPTLTWPESVDQALCYGWIDGKRQSVDDERYKIRFTPRKATSAWSAVNIKRIQELKQQGLVLDVGWKAFEKRKDSSSGYSYEQRGLAKLEPAQQAQLEANAQAWAFFQAQPAGYRKGAIYWVVSAKQEATRARRLAALIADSEAGRTLGPLTRPGAKKS